MMNLKVGGIYAHNTTVIALLERDRVKFSMGDSIFISLVSEFEKLLTVGYHEYEKRYYIDDTKSGMVREANSKWGKISREIFTLMDDKIILWFNDEKDSTHILQRELPGEWN